MSRIGRKPVNIPAGVEVKVNDGVVTVKGPKGTLTQTVHKNMDVKVEGTEVIVTRPDDDKVNRSLHVGYRVQKQGKNLVMNLGYSHQVIVSDTDDITIEAPTPNKIIINGIDKQKVGQFAAEVREKRPPEPYKGKGIKYVDEVVRRKEGKAGKGKK